MTSEEEKALHDKQQELRSKDTPKEDSDMLAGDNPE